MTYGLTNHIVMTFTTYTVRLKSSWITLLWHTITNYTLSWLTLSRFTRTRLTQLQTRLRLTRLRLTRLRRTPSRIILLWLTQLRLMRSRSTLLQFTRFFVVTLTTQSHLSYKLNILLYMYLYFNLKRILSIFTHGQIITRILLVAIFHRCLNHRSDTHHWDVWEQSGHTQSFQKGKSN